MLEKPYSTKLNSSLLRPSSARLTKSDHVNVSSPRIKSARFNNENVIKEVENIERKENLGQLMPKLDLESFNAVSHESHSDDLTNRTPKLVDLNQNKESECNNNVTNRSGFKSNRMNSVRNTNNKILDEPILNYDAESYKKDENTLSNRDQHSKKLTSRNDKNDVEVLTSRSSHTYEALNQTKFGQEFSEKNGGLTNRSHKLQE